MTVDQYATQNVAVLGQVKLPGTFPITAPRSVFDMIALAGGLIDTAGPQHHHRAKGRPGTES